MNCCRLKLVVFVCLLAALVAVLADEKGQNEETKPTSEFLGSPVSSMVSKETSTLSSRTKVSRKIKKANSSMMVTRVSKLSTTGQRAKTKRRKTTRMLESTSTLMTMTTTSPNRHTYYYSPSFVDSGLYAYLKSNGPNSFGKQLVHQMSNHST